MKKLYTFTSDDIDTTIDYANGERNTVNLEDAELLPEGARVLTREEVAHALTEEKYNQRTIEEIVKLFFGDKP